MKKLLCTVSALLIGGMMVLTGCGSNNAYDYDLSQYVKVGQYEGLKYNKPDEITVSDSSIADAIKKDLESAKVLRDVLDGRVHDGDTVNIDYEGTIDGKAFEGGSAEGQSLVIGSNSFIDGFEKGLIGEKVGKKVSLDLTFPKDYQKKELQGKDVTFEVKINSAQNYQVPNESDYVKNNTDYKSVDAYEKAVKEKLYDSEKNKQKSDIEAKLWKKVMSKSELLKSPEKETNAYMDQVKKSVQDYADENDMEFADVLQSYYGMDEESFNEQIKEAAVQNTFEQMVVYSIAREQGIEVTSEEYDKFIADQLEATGYSADEFKKYTGSTYEEYVGGEDYIYFYLHYQKVMDYIYDKAVAK